eukprot:11456073-Karenia_brevis.AAC.1
MAEKGQKHDNIRVVEKVVISRHIQYIIVEAAHCPYLAPYSLAPCGCSYQSNPMFQDIAVPPQAQEEEAYHSCPDVAP